MYQWTWPWSLQLPRILFNFLFYFQVFILLIIKTFCCARNAFSCLTLAITQNMQMGKLSFLHFTPIIYRNVSWSWAIYAINAEQGCFSYCNRRQGRFWYFTHYIIIIYKNICVDSGGCRWRRVKGMLIVIHISYSFFCVCLYFLVFFFFPIQKYQL